MKRIRSWLTPGVALAVFAAGLLATASAMRYQHRLRDRLERRGDTLRALESIRQVRDRHREAQRAFEALPQTIPADPAVLAAGTLTNTVPEFRPLESQPLAGGWARYRTEAVFGDVALTDLVRFLAAVETGRPPWRMVEGDLSASDRADGHVRAVVVLEAVGKRPQAAGSGPAREARDERVGAE